MLVLQLFHIIVSLESLNTLNILQDQYMADTYQ